MTAKAEGESSAKHGDPHPRRRRHSGSGRHCQGDEKIRETPIARFTSPSSCHNRMVLERSLQGPPVPLRQDFPAMYTAKSVLSAVLMVGVMFMSAPSPAAAQSAAPQGNNGQPQQPSDPVAEANKRTLEEFAEASKLPGAAGKAECVWLGRRIATLLFRDDVDTARRHMEIYDRFSCPSEHLRLTFRCVVRQGNIDQKAPESLPQRVHACWLQPDAPVAPQAAQ